MQRSGHLPVLPPREEYPQDPPCLVDIAHKGLPHGAAESVVRRVCRPPAAQDSWQGRHGRGGLPRCENYSMPIF